jgi:hypothetical protein
MPLPQRKSPEERAINAARKEEERAIKAAVRTERELSVSAISTAALRRRSLTLGKPGKR